MLLVAGMVFDAVAAVAAVAVVAVAAVGDAAAVAAYHKGMAIVTEEAYYCYYYVTGKHICKAVSVAGIAGM